MPAPVAPPQSSTRLIGAMCAAEVLGMIGIFSFPALLPEFMQEWALTNTQAGWINGMYFGGYTLAVPVLASLTDRMDGRRIYFVFTGVGVLSAAGFALFAQGFWTALLFRALGGLGLAGTFIPGLKTLVDRVGEAAQARAVSFYTACFGLGTSLSFFATGAFAARFGWRWAFGLAAVAGVLALGLAALALRPQSPLVRKASETHLLDFRPILRNRKAMGYILAYAVHTWELFAFRSWAVAFLAFSLSLQGNGGGYWAPATVAALAGLVATAANLGGGELAFRFGRDRVLTLIMFGSALCACGVGFAAALPYPVVAGLCVVYGALVQGDSAALHTGTVQSADPERRGATMAVQSLIGFGSAALAPLVVGVVLDATGGGGSIPSWGAAFLSMGAVVALGPVFLAVFGRLARGARRGRKT